MKYLLTGLLMFGFLLCNGQVFSLKEISIDTFERANNNANEELFALLETVKETELFKNREDLINGNKLKDYWNNSSEFYKDRGEFFYERIRAVHDDLKTKLDTLMSNNISLSNIDSLTSKIGWCDNWEGIGGNCGNSRISSIDKNNFQTYKNHMIYSAMALILQEAKLPKTETENSNREIAEEPEDDSIKNEEDSYSFSLLELITGSGLSLLFGFLASYFANKRKVNEYKSKYREEKGKRENAELKLQNKGEGTRVRGTRSESDATSSRTDKQAKASKKSTIDSASNEGSKVIDFVVEKTVKEETVVSNATQPSTQKEEQQIVESLPPVSNLTTIIYAIQPNPNGVFIKDSKHKTNQTYFQIAMENEQSTTGIFVLIDDDLIRRQAFNAVDTYLNGSFCNRMITGTPDYNPNRHIIEPGKVKKMDGGKWKVVEPMVVREA